MEISKICLIFATSIILIDMRQIALLLTMMLALSSMAQTAKPQDPKAAIRKHYAAAKAYIEQQQQVEDGGDIYPVTQCFTAQVKQNLPATGYHYEDVKMYYREYYEEYLYDQLGHIEFIYAAQPDLSEGKDYELRFYFHNGELIEVIIKSRQMVAQQRESWRFSRPSMPTGSYRVSLINIETLGYVLRQSHPSSTYFVVYHPPCRNNSDKNQANFLESAVFHRTFAPVSYI